MRTKLPTLVLSALCFLTGKQVIAQDIAQRMQPPKGIELIVNGTYQDFNSPTDYSHSVNYYSSQGNVVQSTLNTEESEELKTLIENIKSGNIDSYSDFVNISRELSESQKQVLLSTISDSLYEKNYDLALLLENPVSQNAFFEMFQNGIASNQNIGGIGACGQISDHIAKLAKDLDVSLTTAEVVTSMPEVNHAYPVLKGENGIVIPDGFNLFKVDTQDVGKAIIAYQKYNGFATFKHHFIEDSKFKYELITPDGERFLKFVDYDKTSKPLKDFLISGKKISAPPQIVVDIGTHLKSLEANVYGLFLKAGQIEGDTSSALERELLIESGFKKTFLTPKLASPVLDSLFGNKLIDINLGLLLGNLEQEYPESLLGWVGDLIYSTNNKEGLNLDFRFSGNSKFTLLENSILQKNNLFFDISIAGGSSYNLVLPKSSITPYLTAKFSAYPADVSVGSYKLALSEFSLGADLDFKLPSLFVSANPYFIYKPWAKQFGAEVSLGNNDSDLVLRGNYEKSTYGFHPDSFNISVGFEGKFDNVIAGKGAIAKIGYSGTGKNYGDKFNWENKLDASLNFKF